MKEFRLRDTHSCRRLLAGLAAVLLLTGCNTFQAVDAPSESPPIPEGILHIPYRAADVLNPYYLESETNLLLMPLIFVPLYELDAQYVPQPVLVKEETELTPTTLLVTLRGDILCSNEEPLTAGDVLYSFEKAKASPCYGAALAGVESIHPGQTAASLVITLTEPNIHARNLLTFPIAKAGTADTDRALPIGAGPYLLQQEDAGMRLHYNRYYYKGLPQTGDIRLHPSGETEAQAFSLETGGIDCCFNALESGEVSRVSAVSVEIPLNYLVYVGVNQDNALLADATLRRAISLLLDREIIAEHGFCGYADAAALPLNPRWQEMAASAYAGRGLTADETLADTLLTAAGFPAGAVNTARTDGTQTLTFRLLCRAGNAFKASAAAQLREQLLRGGILLTVEALPEEAYLTAVKDGDYDLYLAETRLTNDMNLSAFLVNGGALQYGINLKDSAAAEAFAAYRAGAVSTDEFLDAFSNEMPFLPLCFRTGLFCAGRALKNEILCSPENMFQNISVWEK